MLPSKLLVESTTQIDNVSLNSPPQSAVSITPPEEQEDQGSTKSSSSIKRPREDEGTGSLNGEDSWQTVGRQKKKKRTLKADSTRYPTITVPVKASQSDNIRISDIRDIVLYILADGSVPNFSEVSNRRELKKVVIVMVPGLDEALFRKDVDLTLYCQQQQAKAVSPLQGIQGKAEVLTPRHLDCRDLTAPLKPFADMFSQLISVRAPGDDKLTRVYSPVSALLTSPLPRTKKTGSLHSKEVNNSTYQRTRITEFLATADQLASNGFTLHAAMLQDDSNLTADLADGWVATRVESMESGVIPEAEIESKSLTAGHDVLSLDCEMCMTGEIEFALTRISVVNWAGEVVMDELVKPEKPITDYITQYSGITAEKLDPVETRLSDIQARLLDMLTSRTILVGHSLEADLKALQMTHPFIVDTSIIFPHYRGPHVKSSLKFLSGKYLSREIQKGHGSLGHDSVEDARACVDLVRLKCERGKQWPGTDTQGENIFRRLGRAGTAFKSAASGHNPAGGPTGGIEVGKTSAAVDWGDPSKGPGAGATHYIGCTSDNAVVDGVIRAVRGDSDGLEIRGGGVDFVWARMRELEAVQGWRNCGGFEDGSDVTIASTGGLEACLTAVSDGLRRIHEALPQCSAMMVLSGSGNPRPMARMQAMHADFQREYRGLGKTWSELQVKWTDDEEQQLHQAVALARSGIGFICVK